MIIVDLYFIFLFIGISISPNLLATSGPTSAPPAAKATYSPIITKIKKGKACYATKQDKPKLHFAVGSRVKYRLKNSSQTNIGVIDAMDEGSITIDGVKYDMDELDKLKLISSHSQNTSKIILGVIGALLLILATRWYN